MINNLLPDCWDQLERMANDGASVVVKLDGLRSNDRYSLVVSGGKLADDYFRRDGADLLQLVEEAVRYYAVSDER